MSSTGLWDFLRKVISHLSFCFAWLITELQWIILMRFVSLRDVSGARRNTPPKQTRILCERGRINLACMWIREMLYSTLEEIFSASQMSPRWTEDSTPQIVFVLLMGIDAVAAIVESESVCVSSWESLYYMRVCTTCECLCDGAQRISRNLSSAMLMLAPRQTWRLTEEPIIVILEKWSNVSLFLQSSQPRRGCLSLWEDVWLPALNVCFGPLSWFSYTSTFSSKHVKIFHAH